MGYSNNPFNSSAGQDLLKDIFNLMFISPENAPNKIESNDKVRQVNHYRGNIVNIVNKMRKFVKGYQQVAISEATSSGIHICPHCKRRDAIWMWETVDAGHYASANDWLSSVALTEWTKGSPHEKNRYQFAVRYRCNKVTTCMKCHLTTAGSHSSCPNCGQIDVVKVGCGEESYATHFIREYTADDNHPQVRGEGTGAVARNKSKIIRSEGQREEVVGDITGYEYIHHKAPEGKVIKSWEDIKEHTPFVRFTYTHRYSGESWEVDYPISELNYAISKQKVIQCLMGRITEQGGCAHPGKTPILRTPNNDPPEPLRCEYTDRNWRTNKTTYCGATDFGPLMEVHNTYYRPHPMRIMNPQPLEAATAQGGSFKGLPVYTLYLESPVSESFKLLLPLPQAMTLNPIPNDPKISTISSSDDACPNDVGATALETTALKEANEELMQEKEKLIEEARSGTDLSEADAQTNKGFTFDVCEGRSLKAYYDYNIGKWIDDSPPCSSFRKDGTTLPKKREYARWSQIPSYSPHAKPDTDFENYLGPNPDTHFIMDWLKANQALAAYQFNPPKYHTVHKIAETIDEEIGLIYEVMECDTCRKIVDLGGIIPYRQSLGQCDEHGKAIGTFPQQVLDVEIAFEKSYPTKNTKGDPVATAWGIFASNEHDGKEMLLNPDLKIRIG